MQGAHLAVSDDNVVEFKNGRRVVHAAGLPR
jgi:uncharacterized protein (DUF2345 family)